MIVGWNRKYAKFSDRFVSGLYYPAILGANLVLLIEALSNGALQGNLLKVGVPWLLTLFLFVLDYTVMAPLRDDTPPYNTVILSLGSFVIATLFLSVHVQFGTAVKAEALDVSAWSLIWRAFWALHLASAAWCVLLLFTAKSLFRTEPPPEVEMVTKYRKHVVKVLIQIVVQACIIWIVTYFLIASLDEHWKFSVAAVFAIIGWFVRRKITHDFEDRYNPWT